MVFIYYIKLFRKGAGRHSGILMYLLLLAAEAIMHRMRYDIVQRTTLSGKVGDVPNKSENDAVFCGSRLGGKFVSKNVVKLPRRNLSSAEISILSKGLKFVPAATKTDQVKSKRRHGKYGKELSLMWHFRNDEWPFLQEQLTFTQRNEMLLLKHI